MSTSELLAALAAAGVVLTVEGDRLKYDAPAGALTPDLRDRLVRAKPELLMWLTPPRGFVVLRNGPAMPVDVIELALDLEQRGIRLRTDADHQLIVPNDLRLTDSDRAAIARWRYHLACLVEYRVPQVG